MYRNIDTAVNSIIILLTLMDLAKKKIRVREYNSFALEFIPIFQFSQMLLFQSRFGYYLGGDLCCM